MFVPVCVSVCGPEIDCGWTGGRQAGVWWCPRGRTVLTEQYFTQTHTHTQGSREDNCGGEL